ncbi:TRAP transporter large permease [Aliihoeflea sp. 40Bstr573]|uniref:TRAP transporter large permease n=1 Tax=Aliihoeflea sp. 40Bstr573 TaxID=2696467 RepID=UPI00209523BA|nr:TRAP transporter large permease [Aliihoeflea sp. 40Bstr573]MCO6386839.1 TRAP transporter large permease subunit [Aliihoeflea sp. 40Bstr573]
MTTILFSSFLILLVLGFPIAFVLAISAFLAVAFGSNYPMLVIVKEMFSGLDSFPLMAVPFFVLAAELMTGGAMTMVLLRFAAQFVGHLRGGLGYANVLSSAMFSGISGSALADAAGPGAMMTRMMEKSGYDKAYAGALTASSAVMGPIIPPSIIMIIYALQVQEVSVGGLFVAGIVPGILIALALCSTNFFISRKRGYKSDEPRPPVREMVKTTINAIPALLLIVIIIGGIRFGVFTPTEASVVAVFYALLCGMFFYRTLKIRALPEIILRAALVSVSVLLILAAARAFAWVLIIQSVPQTLAAAIIAMELSPIVFLLAVNVLLLAFGLFMDPLPGVMVLVPILAPIATTLGIDPTHFAVVVILNLTIGLITPPVGSLLFVVSSAVDLKVSRLVRQMPPFLLAHLVVLLLITFIPAISTWAPRASGF